MYPVLVSGLVSIALALRLLARPALRHLALTGATIFLTLLAGALGTVQGIRVSTATASKSGVLDDLLQGTSQSLHCMLAALFLTTIATLPAILGAFRLAARADEERGQ
jgi:uncharacterized membrane protein HdeD (DUF308 family)